METTTRWKARILASLTVLLLVTPGTLRADEAVPSMQLYILSFNRWGELENPAERDLAINELRTHQEIERIIIFSYGWANDGESSYGTYRRMMDEITAHTSTGRPSPRTAVIAIGWDSSQTGFRKLFNNVVPFPGIANALAWLPDRLLFPISFWSKSAQADRIGFGGLRSALNEIFAIYEGADPHPEIYLLGHSFGTRILSSLMVDRLGGIEVGSEPFVAAEHVRGAVLLQPALASANLDSGASYPILVTMSRHDHANGFLYPVANVVLNAFGFTLFEAIVQRRILSPVSQTVGTVADVVTGSVRQDPSARRDARRTIVRRTAHLGRRTLGELVALPLSLAFTAVLTPLDYAYIQLRSLATRPLSHVMDTLAQLPVVEVPVAALDGLLGREVPFGQRSKGFFTLGPLHEAMGRMVTPRVFGPADPPVYSLEDLQAMHPLPAGVFAVDASEIVTEGVYGVDLARPIADFTVSWVDPIGAHSDYTNPEVVALLALLANPPAP